MKATVTLRCTPEASDAIVVALTGLPGVEKVELDKTLGIARVAYTGALAGLSILDRVQATDGTRVRIVSHARLTLSVVARDGADRAKLEARLARACGVKQATHVGGNVELFVDFDILTPETLTDAGNGAGFDVRFDTHQWVTLALAKGDATKVVKEMLATNGILAARSDDKGVHLWTQGKFDDKTLRLIADLADAQLGEIARR